MAQVDGLPSGFVAWRSLTPTENIVHDAWELKRLWVRSSARGLGLGRLLTNAVLDRAAQAGRRAVYLDTVPATMSHAYGIYLELGFEPCPAYNDNLVEQLAYLVKFLPPSRADVERTP